MIDSEYLQKGKTYAEMPDVYMIYISETDLWKAGYTVYPVEKYFRNTSIEYEEGQRILYVNAAVDDGSPIAGLMKYFKTADLQDMSQGDLSKRGHYLKCEEGGTREMCEISEKIYQEGIEQGVEMTAGNMIKNHFPDEQILLVTGIPEEKLYKLKNLDAKPAMER